MPHQEDFEQQRQELIRLMVASTPPDVLRQISTLISLPAIHETDINITSNERGTSNAFDQ